MGYAWQPIDLHPEALPLEPGAAAWMADGAAVLMAAWLKAMEMLVGCTKILTKLSNLKGLDIQKEC